MLICWGVVPLWSIIADCELIFSRAPPVGIFRVWAERVCVCKTPSGPASLCSLECSFRGSVVPSYTDCIHLNPKPEADWPIASGSQGVCLSTYGTGGGRYALGSSSLAGGRPPPRQCHLYQPACRGPQPYLPSLGHSAHALRQRPAQSRRRKQRVPSLALVSLALLALVDLIIFLSGVFS